MVRTRRHAAAVRGALAANTFDHPTLWEYIGKNKFLQMAVAKAEAKTYKAKFGTVTGKSLLRAAAKDGHLSVVRWAICEGCRYDESVFLVAAEQGHVDIMQFLFESGCNMPLASCAFWSAARGGSIAALDFLHRQGFMFDSSVCYAAAMAGKCNALKWLRSHGCPWDTQVRVWSAKGGHIEVYKWAHYKDCPGGHQSASSEAIAGGHVSILEFMQEEGFVFDETHCASAASAGQLPTLKWLRTNDVPWDAQVIERAKGKCHAELEMWARLNGCPTV